MAEAVPKVAEFPGIGHSIVVRIIAEDDKGAVHSSFNVVCKHVRRGVPCRYNGILSFGTGVNGRTGICDPNAIAQLNPRNYTVKGGVSDSNTSGLIVCNN